MQREDLRGEGGWGWVGGNLSVILFKGWKNNIYFHFFIHNLPYSPFYLLWPCKLLGDKVRSKALSAQVLLGFLHKALFRSHGSSTRVFVFSKCYRSNTHIRTQNNRHTQPKYNLQSETGTSIIDLKMLRQKNPSHIVLIVALLFCCKFHTPG